MGIKNTCADVSIEDSLRLADERWERIHEEYQAERARPGACPLDIARRAADDWVEARAAWEREARERGEISPAMADRRYEAIDRLVTAIRGATGEPDADGHHYFLHPDGSLYVAWPDGQECDPEDEWAGQVIRIEPRRGSRG